MNRITICGQSGAGKTRLANIIGERLSLPVVELDRFHHVNDWNDTPWDEFRANLEAHLNSLPQGWVCVGNYLMVKDLVLYESDTVVWLRLPFRVVYARLVRRTLKDLITGRPIWEGSEMRESWRQTFTSKHSILLWGISNWKNHVREMNEALKDLPEDTNLLVLRSSAEVEEFLSGLPQG